MRACAITGQPATVSHQDSTPEPVAAPRRIVTLGTTEVVLLGTAHVSKQSVEDVRAELATGTYDAIAVELCEPRHRRLTGTDDWADVDLFKIIRSGRTGMVAAQLALSAYQKRLADQLGIEPGAEMKAAVDGAAASSLPLWLVDRNIGITLKRLVRTVPWYQRWPLLMGILTTAMTRSEVEPEEIETLKEGDMLENTFSEFAERSPRLYNTLVAERDRYMAARLRARIADEQPRRVLVVVGAGHLQGLAEQLERDVDPDTESHQLEHLPPPGQFTRWLPWIVVAVILTGFAIGFSRSPEIGWKLVGDWVLINGTLTAIGAILARGHPLTVVGAFAAAPLTSLNPTVGAGMVTAAIQTFIRPPVMRDFQELRDHITEARYWWTNRLTRVLLVFIFCTAGSAAATYIAGFHIFEQLL